MVFTLVVIAAGVCCPPPLEIPKICPITGERCEPAECTDPTPELIATKVPEAVVPDRPLLASAPQPHPFADAAQPLTFWTAPTRTVVLRI